MALTEAVGPIQTSNEVGMDLKMIPEFVAGFIYGVTGDLKLAEVETCFQSASDLEPMITAFISDLKQVHLAKAFLQLQKFIFHLQADLAPCTEMSADIKTIESWASILERPEELGETLTFNYIMNRKTVNTEIAQEETDWSSASYFDAG